MTKPVEWTAPAVKDLGRLDRQVRERVRQAVYKLAETGQGDVTRLTAKGGELRLKVGDWRLRFELGAEAPLIRILRVRHRREAYRD